MAKRKKKRKGESPNKEVSEGEKLSTQLLQEAMDYRSWRPESKVQQLLRGTKTPQPNVEKSIGKKEARIAKRAQERAKRLASERSAKQSQEAMDFRLQRPESKVQQLLRGTSTPQPNLTTTPDSLEGPPEPVRVLSQRQRRKLARDTAEQASGVNFTPGEDTIGEGFRARREEIIRNRANADDARRASRVVKRDRLRAEKAAAVPFRKAANAFHTASWVLPLVYLGATGGKELIRKNFNVGTKFFDGVTAVDEFLAEEKKAKMLQDQERRRQMKLDMLRQQNLKVLRGLAPGLAASLEAGMELPEDGIMIGGRPRADLLNLVADSMASGGPISMGV
jgi:hypothetical protein